MRSRASLLHRLSSAWKRTGPNSRLALGIAVVVSIWFFGLTPWRVGGVELPWPVMLLAAAVGWSRVGLYMRPVFALIVLSFLYDLTATAPFGSYMIVALSAYGVQVLAQSALDMDNGAVLETLIPFVSLAAGFLVLWGVASVATGYAIRLFPILMTGLSTAILYSFLAPVFDLRTRYGHRAMGG